jgi:taurine dioxygenase
MSVQLDLRTKPVQIDVRPVTGTIGAEIHGVDLSTPLSDETFAAIRQALLDYCVIFFRDQRMTAEQQKAFARRFGELNVHPFVDVGADAEVLEIVKERTERYNFGGNWHSDVSFLLEPPLGSILHALEVPSSGGDTLFVNMFRAYDTLSEGMKEMLGAMRAIHSASKPYGPAAEAYGFKRDLKTMKVRLNEEAAAAEAEHPVVRTHPESGRKALFISRTFTLRFKDMTEEESKPLLDFLVDHALRPENMCRFRWTPGAVAFWDNRCTMHYAVNDYHGQRRHMRRVTINGDRPF